MILHEDHALPQTVVDLSYRVGAKDEPAGRSGFAHLFEHLMFRGTERVPDGQFDLLMEAGGGYNNAGTGQDRTTYWGEGPSELLPTLLWLEADRLRGLAITQEKLDSEREVVRNERRQNFEDRPYGRADLLESRLCYPPDHPYHRGVMGSHADLEAATLADVEEFFDVFYVPNNATLAVAGDFEAAAVRPRIEELFGSIPRGDDVRHRTAPPVRLEADRTHAIVDRVPFARTSLIWHSPPLMEAGDAEMDLVATLLADGITSRLHRALVVEAELAHGVSAAQKSALLGSLFEVVALAREGVELVDLEAAIEIELQAFLAEGIPVQDLERARLGFETRKLQAMQSLQRKAELLSLYELHWGEPDSFRRDLDRYRDATPERCQQWARTVLGAPRTTLQVLPEPDPGAAGGDPLGDAPALGPPSPFEPQAPERFELSNGIAVELWRRSAVPLVEIGLALPVGSVQDPPGAEGTAALVGKMLDEGAGERDARAFAAALESLGASFSSAVDHDRTHLRLTALARHLDRSLELFGDAVLRPRFLAREWERVRREHQAALRLARENPSSVARTAGLALFFGRGHPYGRPTSGTPASVEALDQNDLVELYSDAYRPEGAVLFVAGDVDRAALEAKLEEVFGGWNGLLSPSGRHERPAVGPRSTDGPRLAALDRPGAPQTVVRITLPALPFSAPERLAHEVLSAVLGGTFTSRLNQNLRVDKGITYGAATGLVHRPSAAYLVATASVESEHTAVALREFLAELERLRGGDVTEDEAVRARSALRQEAVQAFAGLAGVITIAAERSALGATVESLGTELATLATLDAAAVNAAAEGFVDLQAARVLLVGDGETVAAALAELGLGPPVWVDAEGLPVEER